MLISLILGASLAARASTRDSADVRLAARVAGCYELEPGPWQADPAFSRVFAAERVPRRFALTAERLAGWEPLQRPDRQLYRAVAAPSAGQAGMLFAYWRRAGSAGDTVHVSYPLPMAGAALDLTPDGRDLAGRITAFTDAVTPGEPSDVSRPARARRVPCAPPAGAVTSAAPSGHA
jgi:hypothetical protein